MGDMLRVNVRTLAEFYYEGGDLESGRAQLRRMLEGARGHRLLQSRYEEDWRSEAAVSMELDRRNRHMELHGRIDGLKKADAHAWIEEIKTTEADVSLMTGGGASRSLGAGRAICRDGCRKGRSEKRDSAAVLL